MTAALRAVFPRGLEGGEGRVGGLRGRVEGGDLQLAYNAHNASVH